MALTAISYSNQPGSGFGLSALRRTGRLSPLGDVTPSSGSTGAAAPSAGALAQALSSPTDALVVPGVGRTVPTPGVTLITAPSVKQPTSAGAVPGSGSGSGAGAGAGSGSGGNGAGTTTDTGSTGAGTATPNLDADPILTQIKQLASSSDQQAQAAANAGKIQLVEQLGDAGLAKALGLGENVAGVAAQNPYSTLAGLDLAHGQNVGAIDTRAGLNNTFFGSVHANDLANEANAYQQGRYNAEQQARAGLGQIDQTLSAALQGNADKRAQAAADAYTRWLAQHPTAQDTTTPGASTASTGGTASTGSTDTGGSTPAAGSPASSTSTSTSTGASTGTGSTSGAGGLAGALGGPTVVSNPYTTPARRTGRTAAY